MDGNSSPSVLTSKVYRSGSDLAKKKATYTCFSLHLHFIPVISLCSLVTILTPSKICKFKLLLTNHRNYWEQEERRARDFKKSALCHEDCKRTHTAKQSFVLLKMQTGRPESLKTSRQKTWIGAGGDKFAREPSIPIESRTFVLTNVTTYEMLCDANQVKNCYARDTRYCNATDLILNQFSLEMAADVN